MTTVKKDKKWIQKAVNPAHKGFCTPMSKPTCTPKRKALARTFKAMAKNNNNSNNGEPPFQKGGTAKEKAQAAVDRARMQYNRDFAAMKRKRGLVPPPTPISKSIQIPSYSKYKSGGTTKTLPKAQLGAIMNGIARLKKVYNMYNAAKQSSKLTKLPAAKKVKKSGVTKLMSKSFNAIKNKKK